MLTVLSTAGFMVTVTIMWLPPKIFLAVSLLSIDVGVERCLTDCSVLRIFVFTTVGVKRVTLAHCTPQSCPIFVYREADTPLLCSRGFLYEQKN